MYVIRKYLREGRPPNEFVYQASINELYKHGKPYFKVPRNPDEEFGQSILPHNGHNVKPSKKQEYYQCHKCHRDINPGTTVACCLKCSYDYCLDCWTAITGDHNTDQCSFCHSEVDKILVTDRLCKIPVMLDTMFDNSEEKFVNQFKLFCPFKMNGCQISLTLPLHVDSQLIDLAKFCTHMNEFHNMFICALCINRNREMPKDVVFFTETEFIQHMQTPQVKSTNFGQGFEGFRHEVCELCDLNNWYMDQKCLSQHCKALHLECEVCEEVYAETQEALMMHYQKDHSYCNYCQKPIEWNNFSRHMRTVHLQKSLDFLKQTSKEDEQKDSLAKKFTLTTTIERVSPSGVTEVVEWDSPTSDAKAYKTNFPSIDGKSKEFVFASSTSSTSPGYSKDFPSLSGSDAQSNPMVEQSIASAATTSTSFVNTPVEWSRALVVDKTSKHQQEAYPSLTLSIPIISTHIEKPSEPKPSVSSNLDYSRMVQMSIDNQQFKFKLPKDKKSKMKSTKQMMDNDAKMVPPETSSAIDFPGLEQTAWAQKPSNEKAKKAQMGWLFCGDSSNKLTKSLFPINPPVKNDDANPMKKNHCNENVGKSPANKTNGIQPPSLDEFPCLGPPAAALAKIEPKNKKKISYKRAAENSPSTQNKITTGGGGGGGAAAAAGNHKKKNNYKKPGQKK